jgi:hypothetical protein
MIEPDQLTDPERKLWAYVLLQAQSDLGSRDSVARSARLWFSSRDDSIGSFTWICHHLSLEPNAVRQRVLQDATKRPPQAIANAAEIANRAA